MTDDIAQTWDQVDIPLTFKSPAEGEPGAELVSSTETRAAVREMLKDHFPEGPAAAIESTQGLLRMGFRQRHYLLQGG